MLSQPSLSQPSELLLCMLLAAGAVLSVDYGHENSRQLGECILVIFYPPLKKIWGCVWLCLQAQEGNIYFTELAERVEYGKYGVVRQVVFADWASC